MQITSCRESLAVVCRDFPKARNLVLAMGICETRSLAYHHREFKAKEKKLSAFERGRYKSFFEDMKEWYELYRSLHRSGGEAKRSWEYWVSHTTDGLKAGTYRERGGKIVRRAGSDNLKTVKIKFSQLV